jgi:hypothetical protein
MNNPNIKRVNVAKTFRHAFISIFTGFLSWTLILTGSFSFLTGNFALLTGSISLLTAGSAFGDTITDRPLGEFFNDTGGTFYESNKEAERIVNRIVAAAGGFGRWKKQRTVSQTINVEFFDEYGQKKLLSSTNERFLFKKDKSCTYLANSVNVGNKEVVYATNGFDTWVTVDGIAVDSDGSHEKALRRLRESWFWLRFPFSLKQMGTVVRISGEDAIKGGRIPVWLIDVLPAKRGDLWPEGFIRLVVNKKTSLIEGVVFPRTRCEFSNLRAEYSNLVSVNGIFLPHKKEYFNEEGIVARETITSRSYNIPIPERYFHKPVFDAW